MQNSHDHLALHCRCGASRQPTRRGLTLVEMLVSVTLTLLIVFAIVQVFDLLGDAMAKGRATIEMAGNLRSVANRLQTDLDNITCPVQPWLDPAAGQGYFKYVEGLNDPFTQAIGNQTRSSDQNADADDTVNLLDTNGDGIPDQETAFGDTDDVLMFTTGSGERPFTGRHDPVDLNNLNGFATIESNTAEVIWWTRQVSPTGPIQLHRRALLIRPDLNVLPGGLIFAPGGVMSPIQLRNFLNTNDISVRVVTNPAGEPIGLAANTLGDLTTPRNRFGHYPLDVSSPPGTPSGTFSPTPVDWAYDLDLRYLDPLFGGGHEYHLVLAQWQVGGTPIVDRRGDDVMTSDVLAFDVKAYDPDAPLFLDNNNTALAPHDPGYDFATVNAMLPAVPQGAFVDLFYTSYATGLTANFGLSKLAFNPNVPVTTGGPPLYVSYDTWSIGLERDGLDQNQINGPDEGVDGVDTPNDAGNTVDGIDDYDERETRPPYDVPLTGIEVKIRTIEYGTRQVRQVSVVGDFTN
jgi:hypothetical protein